MENSLTDEAVRLAKTDPHRSLELAAQLLTDPDQQVQAQARFARGRALYELARNDEALVELDLARQAATTPELTSRIEISTSGALIAAGRREEARALIDAIMTNEDPVIAALARSQSGFLSLGDGALAAAANDLRQSIEPLERSPADGDAAARAVGNLAYCEMVLGDLDEAEASYRRAVDLGRRFDEGLVVAGCLQNLGYLAMRRGHLGEAIERLADAEQAYRSMKGPARNLSTLFDDMAETHRIAGLTGSASRYATAALESVVDGGNEEKIAEARYRLAACALDGGDFTTARQESERAAKAFDAAGREVWVYRAWSISLDAVDGSEPLDHKTLLTAKQATEELELAGWLTDALRIRNRIAQRLLAGNDHQELDSFLKAPVDNPDQSIMSQLEGLFSSALVSKAAGNSAIDDLLAAHSLITSHYQRLADPEMRAGAARLLQRFRQMSLDEIDPANQPTELLVNEERWRALSFDLPRVVPSSDPRLAKKSEELRFAAAELAAAEQWDPEAAARVQQLETEIQPLSLQTRSRALEAPEQTAALDLPQLRENLAGRTFIEWIEIGEELIGVMVTPDDVVSWSCGSAEALRASSQMIMSTVARILRPGQAAVGQERSWGALSADCQTIGDRLLPSAAGSFGAMVTPDLPSDDPSIGFVLSPPPALAGLPWPLILGASDRSICLTPSATAWIGRRTGSIEPRIGIAIGPELPFGNIDTDRISACFDEIETLTGEQATAGATRALIGRSQVMHIAAHGTFRSDSPRFSTLLFDDGPLALYELDSETAVAPLVILAACDAGRTASRSGSEMLGFGPTLLNVGATNVIAPTVPVADREMSEFIGCFYEKLTGRTPSGALAAARGEYSGRSIRERVLASAVLCFGADCGYVSTVTSDSSDPM